MSRRRAIRYNEGMLRHAPSVSYFRNFIFGVEDSLVSTVGLLSGIAIANVPQGTIFLTGVVLIFVEAFSMAAGSFLSESSAQEYADGASAPTKRNAVSGIIMFFSYFVSGFVPLSAYLIWPVTQALEISIAFSLVALFALGVVGARIARIGVLKNAFRMALIGGVAIGVGLFAGILVPRL